MKKAIVVALLLWGAVLVGFHWASVEHQPTMGDWVSWEPSTKELCVRKLLEEGNYAEALKHNGDLQKVISMVVAITDDIIDANVVDWEFERRCSIKYVVLNAYSLTCLRLGYWTNED